MDGGNVTGNRSGRADQTWVEDRRDEQEAVRVHCSSQNHSVVGIPVAAVAAHLPAVVVLHLLGRPAQRSEAGAGRESQGSVGQDRKECRSNAVEFTQRDRIILTAWSHWSQAAERMGSREQSSSLVMLSERNRCAFKSGEQDNASNSVDANV